MTGRAATDRLRPPFRAFAVALAAGFALRLVAGFALNIANGLHRGFDFYGTMADNVVSGRGLVWSFYGALGDKWANRAPLYPLLVAGVRWLAGSTSTAPVLGVQAALGALACLVPAFLALRWGGRRGAIVAVWAAALWPYSVVTDTGMVEHVVFAPLAGLTILVTLLACDGGGRAAGVSAGVIAGLATLARITFAVTAPLVALVAAVRCKRPLLAVLFAAGLCVALVPWVLRNHAVTGSHVLGTDGGRALWVGNSPHTFTHYPAGSIDESERDMLAALTPQDAERLRSLNDDEVAQDAVFREIAVREIASHPAEMAWKGVRKAAALWSPVMNPGPSGTIKLAVFGASILLLFAGACAAAVATPQVRADLPVVLAAFASFTFVAAVFWGQSRYLAPLHGAAAT